MVVEVLEVKKIEIEMLLRVKKIEIVMLEDLKHMKQTYILQGLLVKKIVVRYLLVVEFQRLRYHYLFCPEMLVAECYSD